VTAPPTYKHQTIVGELMLTLGSFVRERGLGKALTAPLDVKLPFGIGSPVQPDLIVLRTAIPRMGRSRASRAYRTWLQGSSLEGLAATTAP
jgi:hypothetical protein